MYTLKTFSIKPKSKWFGASDFKAEEAYLIMSGLAYQIREFESSKGRGNVEITPDTHKYPLIHPDGIDVVSSQFCRANIYHEHGYNYPNLHIDGKITILLVCKNDSIVDASEANELETLIANFANKKRYN